MEIREVLITDEEYPQVLREINDPPKKLYVRGSLDVRGLPSIAIVGTRKQTDYGVRVTKQIVSQIAANCVVVSGLAYGTDGLAHQTALESGGITWAVLGCGIDDASIYPSAHRGLAMNILKSGGALISEYPPGAAPLPHHFPLRNRIIVGLCSKVVIIEAAEKSGALITGRLGLDYNREVLAVPGPITSEYSRGTNLLIKEGAMPALEAGDIVAIQPMVKEINLTGVEQIIYKSLMLEPRTVDEIVILTSIVPGEVNTVLTLLEMKGVVTMVQGRFGITENYKIETTD